MSFLKRGAWARGWDCCRECGGTQQRHGGHGLCKHCWERQYRRKHPQKRRLIICKRCGEEGRHQAFGLCGTCYYRFLRSRDLEGYRGMIRENQRRWRARHRQKDNERCRVRYAFISDPIGPVDEDKIYELNNNRCFYCGSKKKLELDHIIPFAKGGLHCEENLVVACRRCNASKKDRHLMEWIRTQPRSRVWLF